jgi:hypothetical protein
VGKGARRVSDWCTLTCTQMKIAVCFSGHIRGYDKCKDNIEKYLIDPLRKSGTVDLYASVWDTAGHRNKWDESISPTSFTGFKSILIEKFDRQHFLTKYHSQKWNTKYSSSETSGDGASMWYKAKGCFQLLQEEYDLVFRVRPDIIYDKPFELPHVVEKGVVYMPAFHGKYPEVTFGIMDHFAFGDIEAMSVYFNTFDNIPKYIDNKEVCTGENFLRLQLRDTKIIRFNISYSVQRRNGVEVVSKND